MTLSSSFRLPALLLIFAGMLFGSFMFFHPSNNPQGAIQPIWVPVHCAWLLAYCCLTCSFIPLYDQLANRQNMIAQVSYWCAFMGTILSLPIAVWDAFIVPYLANHAPDFIIQIEEISVETPVLAFRVLFFSTVLLFSIGFLLYGISIVRSGIAPNLTGLCLAIGAPLFWVGALFFSQGAFGNLTTEIGAFLFGAGLVTFGITLWAKQLTTA